MNIILLHGDYTSKSYKRFSVFVKEAKNRDWKIVRVPSKEKLSLPEVLRRKSLFNEKSLIVINDLSKIPKKDIEWLKKESDSFNQTLVIYEKRLVNKRSLSSLPKINKIEEYSLPKYIWSFLDSFYPGNVSVCLGLFQKTIKKEPVEFVFALLARHLKDIYLLKEDNNADLPSWKRAKLLSQANKFGKEDIKNIITKLSIIDIKSKQSKLKLSDSLDFLIISELE